MLAVDSGGHILICARVRIFERFVATQHDAKLSSVRGLHWAAVMRRRSTALASIATITAAIDAVESRRIIFGAALPILCIAILRYNKT
jgi:hypothetical protein